MFLFLQDICSIVSFYERLKLALFNQTPLFERIIFPHTKFFSFLHSQSSTILFRIGSDILWTLDLFHNNFIFTKIKAKFNNSKLKDVLQCMFEQFKESVLLLSSIKIVQIVLGTILVVLFIIYHRLGLIQHNNQNKHELCVYEKRYNYCRVPNDINNHVQTRQLQMKQKTKKGYTNTYIVIIECGKQIFSVCFIEILVFKYQNFPKKKDKCLKSFRSDLLLFVLMQLVRVVIEVYINGFLQFMSVILVF